MCWKSLPLKAIGTTISVCSEHFSSFQLLLWREWETIFCFGVIVTATCCNCSLADMELNLCDHQCYIVGCWKVYISLFFFTALYPSALNGSIDNWMDNKLIKQSPTHFLNVFSLIIAWWSNPIPRSISIPHSSSLLQPLCQSGVMLPAHGMEGSGSLQTGCQQVSAGGGGRSGQG